MDSLTTIVMPKKPSLTKRAILKISALGCMILNPGTLEDCIEIPNHELKETDCISKHIGLKK
jgi:hypothetical protein